MAKAIELPRLLVRMRRVTTRRSWPLGAYLGLFAVATLIPVLLIIYYLLSQTAQHEREFYLQRAELVARDLSSHVDREMDRAIAVAHTLGTSPQLLSADLKSFHAQSREAAKLLDAVIALRDESGQQLSNSAVAFGTALPVSGPAIRELDREAAATQKPVISDLVTGTVLNRHLVLVDFPMRRENGQPLFLNIALSPERFGSEAAAQMPDGWIAALVDRTGHVISRSRDPQRFVGTSSNRSFLETATGEQGHWEGLTLEGIPIVGAYYRSPLTGWRVAVAVPRTTLQGPSERAVASLVGLSVASIFLSVLLAWAFSQHISAAVLALVTQARRVGAGHDSALRETTIDEVNEVGLAMLRSSQELDRRERASHDAETVARQIGESLQLVQSTAGIGTIDYDMKAQRLVCSPQFYDMLGLEPGRAVTRRRFIALVHPDDRARIGDMIAKLTSMGGSFEEEFRIVTANGCERWIQTRGLVTAEHGQPVRLIGATIDITRLKLSERALKASERRFRGTFDNAAVGVCHVSLTGRWLEVTDRMCEIVGYPRTELLAKTFQDITHPDDLPTDLQLIKKILTGKLRTYSLDKRYIRKNGSQVWVGITVSLQHDEAGAPEYFIAIVRDISSRIAAQQELEDRLREIEALYDNAPVGLTVLDRDRRFVRINRALAEMNGIAPQSHVGRVAWDLLPSFKTAAEPVIAEVFATGKTIEIELSGETPAEPGQKRYWMEKFYPLKVGDGRITGVGITVEEITARKRYEEHIRFVMRELSHRSKNLLALVQAMASQTGRSAQNMDEFRERFGQRLRGLAASHDLLVSQNWQGVPVEELVRRQLAPFVDVTSERVVLSGPAVTLKAETAQTLGLALHELGTNAVKHGALKDPNGRIDVSWSTGTGSTGEPVFKMDWVERAGRPIEPPTRQGFGNSVLERMLESSLAGRVEMRYPASGFVWRVEVPASCLAA